MLNFTLKLDRTLFALTLRKLLLLGGGLTLLVVLGTVVAVHHTASPEFCKSCHLMKPYYDSWAASSHRKVPCVDCHYEPGIMETLEGKFKAISQVAKYVTRTAGTKPWAEISDQSCMRSGCHSQRLIEGTIKFGRVKFDHRHHLLEKRRGKKLRCTSCHSQLVQGKHMTVSQEACFLCHFKVSASQVSAPARPISDCNLCHGPPRNEIHLGPFTFRHQDYLERGTRCLDCHGDVTRGNGEVPRNRCGNCHNQQAHIEKYQDTPLLHEKHVSEHKVECLSCHEEITHRLPARNQHIQTPCQSCHASGHTVQEKVYQGINPWGDKIPSAMFLARVTCNGCHTELRLASAGNEEESPRYSHALTAENLTCNGCHGPGFDRLVKDWQDTTRTGLAVLETRLSRPPAGKDRKAWQRAASPAVRKAAEIVDFIAHDGSQGVHNPLLVRDLLRAASSGLDGEKAATPCTSLPEVPRVRTPEGCTTLCHTRIETREVAVEDKILSHGRHLLSGKLTCAACHDPARHKTTTARTAADCNACHHGPQTAKTTPCADCHPEKASYFAPGQTPPNPMAEVGCQDCHGDPGKPEGKAASRQSCASCHDESYASQVDAWDKEEKEILARLESSLQARETTVAPATPAPGGPEAVQERRRGFHDRLQALRLIKGIHFPARFRKEAGALQSDLEKIP